MNCDCNENPIHSCTQEPHAPVCGTAFIQFPANVFFKGAENNQLVSIFCFVRYVGTPPHLYGGGVYKVEIANGYPDLIGNMYSLSYSSVKVVGYKKESK
jgi:hypothetical protein